VTGNAHNRQHQKLCKLLIITESGAVVAARPQQKAASAARKASGVCRAWNQPAPRILAFPLVVFFAASS
jgi:hypothetical protein